MARWLIAALLITSAIGECVPCVRRTSSWCSSSGLCYPDRHDCRLMCTGTCVSTVPVCYLPGYMSSTSLAIFWSALGIAIVCCIFICVSACLLSRRRGRSRSDPVYGAVEPAVTAAAGRPFSGDVYDSLPVAPRRAHLEYGAIDCPRPPPPAYAPAARSAAAAGGDRITPGGDYAAPDDAHRGLHAGYRGPPAAGADDDGHAPRGGGPLGTWGGAPSKATAPTPSRDSDGWGSDVPPDAHSYADGGAAPPDTARTVCGTTPYTVTREPQPHQQQPLQQQQQPRPAGGAIGAALGAMGGGGGGSGAVGGAGAAPPSLSGRAIAGAAGAIAPAGGIGAAPPSVTRARPPPSPRAPKALGGGGLSPDGGTGGHHVPMGIHAAPIVNPYQSSPPAAPQQPPLRPAGGPSAGPVGSGASRGASAGRGGGGGDGDSVMTVTGAGGQQSTILSVASSRFEDIVNGRR